MLPLKQKRDEARRLQLCQIHIDRVQEAATLLDLVDTNLFDNMDVTMAVIAARNNALEAVKLMKEKVKEANGTLSRTV